jgi:hypothetical protein
MSHARAWSKEQGAKTQRKSDRINPPLVYLPTAGMAGKQDQQDGWSLCFGKQ